MKNDLTTGTWQDNIWCPINIILLCTSDDVITLTAAATTKTTIGNNDDRRLTTLGNSASTAALIGLPPKMAKFCHILNIFLVVGRWCRRALLWLYFNSCVSVGRSVRNKGCRALGGLPPKGLKLGYPHGFICPSSLLSKYLVLCAKRKLAFNKKICRTLLIVLVMCITN